MYNDLRTFYHQWGNAMLRLKECLKLFMIFFRVGAFTFGGGYSMIPILRHEFVNRRGWITDEEMLNFIAVSQSTPGIIAVNMAVFISHKREKLMGALFAVTGVILPSLIVISAIAAFFGNFAEIPVVMKALVGINITVAVILISAVFDLGKKTITDVICFIIATASFVCVAVFGISSIWLILVSLFLGILVRGGKVLK
jgi:chromate transporter